MMKQLLLISALAISVGGWAQKVNGKLNFPKGGKLEVVVDTKKSTTLEIMGQSMETNATATLTESYDIEDASANGATIEHKVKHLVANMEAMGNSQSFDSEKESDRKGELGKAMEKGLKNKYKMTVDNAGRITSIKADDDNPNGKSKEEDPAAKMASMQMGVNLGVPKLGEGTIFKILPEKEVGKGDTWTDSSSQGGIRKQTVYTVNSITATDIILDFTEEINSSLTQEMMGTEAVINMVDKATGQVTLDKNTGLLKQKTVTGTSTGTLEAQGMTIPISGKTTVTIAVKPA